MSDATDSRIVQIIDGALAAATELVDAYVDPDTASIIMREIRAAMIDAFAGSGRVDVTGNVPINIVRQ